MTRLSLLQDRRGRDSGKAALRRCGTDRDQGHQPAGAAARARHSQSAHRVAERSRTRARCARRLDVPPRGRHREGARLRTSAGSARSSTPIARPAKASSTSIFICSRDDRWPGRRASISSYETARAAAVRLRITGTSVSSVPSIRFRSPSPARPASLHAARRRCPASGCRRPSAPRRPARPQASTPLRKCSGAAS